MILAELNKLIGRTKRYVCMVRPRRFGKSYVGNLISAYYTRGFDSRSLFDGLKISSDSSFDKNLNKYDVIQIDLGGTYSGYTGETDHFVAYLTETIRRELLDVFPEVAIPGGTSLVDCIQTVYQQTGHKFVVFIDEYDVLVRLRAPDKLFKQYLNILNALFKNLNIQKAIAFAYITGILPIVRDKFQSKLNSFEQITFLSPGKYAEFMGFTEEETKVLCEEYQMSYDECKLWYDGYKLAEGISVLDPLSVCQAMTSHRFDDYWSQTSSFAAVLDVIKFSKFEFKDIVLSLVRGEKVPVDVSTYMNTMTDFHSTDDVLTYCIQLGYLTYDSSTKRCYIPNAEVRRQWEYIAGGLDETKVVASLLKQSESLLQSLIARDSTAVARGLAAAHNVVCTSKGYNDEAAFQAAISYAFYYAQNAYTIVKELPTGKGFADVVFLPKYPTLNFPAFVLELKVGSATDTAMAQIENRQYVADMLHYRGNMLLVGVGYDAKTKEHTCQINEMVV